MWLYAYVKHLTLNSVIEQELRDGMVEDDTGQSQHSKLCLTGLCSCESLHSKCSDKIYVNK